MPVTIVMPKTTPTVKIMQTEAVGGKVVLEGETFDEAYAHARLLEAERGMTFVHPFDDPQVAAGQAHAWTDRLVQLPPGHALLRLLGAERLVRARDGAYRSLRALVKHLSGISDADITDLEIPTGQPIIYDFDGSAVTGARYYLKDA